jgi:threonylcarbamoyladenosine tRNA methylthiotransferase MtaB
MHSRPADEIVAEVRRLLENGYREIVLTGIHLGHYGVDNNRGRPKSEWVRLSHLLRRLVALDGDFRIRLSSIEATEVTRELLEVMAEFPERICPHLHISMQSGSDAVLRRMRRRWGSRRFIDRCLLAKQMLQVPALTTDIIVGFPGESEDDFLQTCEAAEEAGFSKIHIFPFSPRRSTPAATMPDQISKQVKSERSAHLAEVESHLRLRYFESLLGRELRVLVESRDKDQPECAVGTSCRYAPVEVPWRDDAEGQFMKVVGGEVRDDRILAASAENRV